MYKGQKHNQGDNWDDGCVYRCVCEDASIGKWRCRERYESYQKKKHLDIVCYINFANSIDI